MYNKSKLYLKFSILCYFGLRECKKRPLPRLRTKYGHWLYTCVFSFNEFQERVDKHVCGSYTYGRKTFGRLLKERKGFFGLKCRGASRRHKYIQRALAGEKEWLHQECCLSMRYFFGSVIWTVCWWPIYSMTVQRIVNYLWDKTLHTNVVYAPFRGYLKRQTRLPHNTYDRLEYYLRPMCEKALRIRGCKGFRGNKRQFWGLLQLPFKFVSQRNFLSHAILVNGKYSGCRPDMSSIQTNVGWLQLWYHVLRYHKPFKLLSSSFSHQ